jgi:hypothetical protein
MAGSSADMANADKIVVYADNGARPTDFDSIHPNAERARSALQLEPKCITVPIVIVVVGVSLLRCWCEC